MRESEGSKVKPKLWIVEERVRQRLDEKAIEGKDLYVEKTC